MPIDLAHRIHRGPHGTDNTVVLLGSLGSDGTMWEPQIGPLTTVADVVTVDMRGHGRSPVVPGPFSIADLGVDVLSLLDHLELTRVHVAGLSLGGAVAQWLAIKHPARVRSLTLLCTAAQFGDPGYWRARGDSVRRDGVGAIAAAAVDRWFTPALAERDRPLIERMHSMVAGTDDQCYAACCDAIAEWDSRDDLTRICAPTLVIAGAQDAATPPTMLAEIAAGVRGADFHTLADAAHLVNIEQADLVSELLVTHIARESSSGPAVR